MNDLPMLMRSCTTPSAIEPVLCACHGDPNPSNMIRLPSGTIQLIDWSHAGLNDPWLDFAIVCQYIPASARQHWASIISGHHHHLPDHIAHNPYEKLLYLHCCLWATSQAVALTVQTHEPAHVQLAANIEQLRQNPSSESLTAMQTRWLNGQFDLTDAKQYLALALLMMEHFRHAVPSHP